MLHGETGAESILGDLDEFIASVDHALDGTDGRRSRRRAQVDLLRRVERNVARDRGHVRARHLMTLTHRFGNLASAMREPMQILLRGHHRERDVPSTASAPACTECGAMLVGDGSCYECLDCGSMSGCS